MEVTTSSSVTVSNLDQMQIVQRMNNISDLLVFQSIVIFSILIFLAFEIALRGFFKLGR